MSPRVNSRQIRLNVAVGEAVLSARVAAGMTRSELARRLGTYANTLAKIESGDTPCPLHLLVGVADEFDCSLDALVPVLLDSKNEAAE